MIEPINHYSITNPATTYDEDSMTVLQLCGRLGAKTNEIIKLLGNHDISIADLARAIKTIDNHMVGIANTLGDLVVEPLGFATPQMFGATGDGVADDTQAIKSAIQALSEHNAVLYFPPGTYLVTDDIELKSNITVKGAGENSVIKRAPTEAENYRVFRCVNLANVNICDLSIHGDKSNHTGTTGEWGMCVSLEGSRNISIERCWFMEGWGDGVYVGSEASKNLKCYYITIRDCKMVGNRRNGLSVINVSYLTVDGCMFSNNKGTAPQAGICFEPNNQYETIDNAIVRGCVFVENNIDIDATLMCDGNIKVASCIFRSPTGFAFNSSDKEVVGSVSTPQLVFDGCEFYNRQNCMNLYKKSVDALPLTFRGCQLSSDNVCVQIGAYGLVTDYDYGGIFFYDCQIKKNSTTAGSVRFQLGAETTHKLIDSAFQLHYDNDIVPWFYFTHAGCVADIDITGGKAKEATGVLNITKSNLYPLVIAGDGCEVYFTTECPVGMSVKVIGSRGLGGFMVDGTSYEEVIVKHEHTTNGWLKEA